MSKTERLYYADSHLTVFDATVIEVTDRVSGWAGVTLDRTAFYPTGGGQPSDVGFLNSARVVECIDQDQKGILHLVEGEVPRPGEHVTGRVDWATRLDHMQQHTGQHILSQAFINLYGAETRGFRMMKDASEIDVELENPSDARIQTAVELANEVIWDNRETRIHNVTSEEAKNLPLRKDSEREGVLRIIEIDQFDFSPCGGTHAVRSGEVGAIAVRSWDRSKGMTRIVFLAGGRAVADYNRANAVGRNVAAMFSAGRDDAPGLVAKLIDENKHLIRRNAALESIAAKVEAEEMVSRGIRVGDFTVVAEVLERRDAESLKRLALALASHQKTVALLGSKEEDTARLVFARSVDARGDMNQLLKVACATLDGRGGGKPDMAQGGGRRITELDRVLKEALESLREEIG